MTGELPDGAPSHLPSELPVAPAAEQVLVDAPEAPTSRFHANFAFTARGGEYFRIWVVNLLFTLATFGIYSAWAKVRKARYFRQNTRLDGHVFDYHARPGPILRGRIIALVLFAAYSWAFQFSVVAGLVTIGVLCAAGPWLFLRAQQFSLANTSYRGLRFGFVPGPGEAYATLLPAIALWLAPSVVLGLLGSKYDVSYLRWFGVTSVALLLLLPALHHRIKSFQRRGATYGDRQFEFQSDVGGFYAVYLKGLLFIALAGILGAICLVVFAALDTDRAQTDTKVASTLAGVGTALGMYLVAWPYFATRLQQIVWKRTRLGDMRFRTEVQAGALFGLALKNVLLTLLTAGLYWPWAAVAMARYRVECMHMDADAPWAAIAAGLRGRPVSATGEGAADAFGFDIGL